MGIRAAFSTSCWGMVPLQVPIPASAYSYMAWYKAEASPQGTFGAALGNVTTPADSAYALHVVSTTASEFRFEHGGAARTTTPSHPLDTDWILYGGFYAPGVGFGSFIDDVYGGAGTRPDAGATAHNFGFAGLFDGTDGETSGLTDGSYAAIAIWNRNLAFSEWDDLRAYTDPLSLSPLAYYPLTDINDLSDATGTYGPAVLNGAWTNEGTHPPFPPVGPGPTDAVRTLETKENLLLPGLLSS